jgi:hypothetical protein
MDSDFIGERIQVEEKPISVENYEEEEGEEDEDQETTYDHDEDEENITVDYVDAEEMKMNGNGEEEMDGNGTIGDADDSTAADEGNNNLLMAIASIQAHLQQCQMEKKEWQKGQMEIRKLQAMLNVAEKQKAEMVRKNYSYNQI